MTRIGILLTQDNAIDRELWQWCPPDVSLHVTRLQVPGVDDLDELDWELAMHSEAVLKAATLSLTEIEPDLVVFACTSSSFVEGFAAEPKIGDMIRRSGARDALTTSAAVVEALRALEVRRVAVGTPYSAWLGERLRPFLTDAGFEVNSLSSKPPDRLDLTTDREIEELAERAYQPGVDAIFLSCTALETRHLVAPLTRRFGVPVITAMQATMWAALARVGKRAVGPEHPLHALDSAAA